MNSPRLRCFAVFEYKQTFSHKEGRGGCGRDSVGRPWLKEFFIHRASWFVLKDRGENSKQKVGLLRARWFDQNLLHGLS